MTESAEKSWPKKLGTKIAFVAIFCCVFLFCRVLHHLLGTVGRGGFDEINFHLPTVLDFAALWPRLPLGDYLSATTPGYHMVLAYFVRIFNPLAAELLSTGFTAFLISYLIYRVAAAVTPPAETKTAPLSPRSWVSASVLVLPLLLSPYVLSSGVWLLPDNLAWLLVLLVLLNSLAGIFYYRFLAYAAFFLFLLVCVRQIHIWAASTILAAAYCAKSMAFFSIELSSPPKHFLIDLKNTIFRNPPKQLLRTSAAAICILPSVLILVCFIKLWHGLTPPTFQGQYPVDASKPLLFRLFNAPAAPAFILALFGVFGLFYAGFWLPALLKSLRTRSALFLLVTTSVLAFLFAIIPATTESIPLGRWSGLWQFTSRLPIIASHTSTLILSLALLGAVTLCGFLTSMRASHAVVCLTAIAGFATAQAASFQLWQRYNEPFILIMLILMTTISIAQRDEKEPSVTPLLAMIHRLRFAGPAILALALATLSYTTFKNAKPSDFFDLKPGTDRTRAFLKGDETIKPVPLPAQNP